MAFVNPLCVFILLIVIDALFCAIYGMTWLASDHGTTTTWGDLDHTLLHSQLRILLDHLLHP